MAGTFVKDKSCKRSKENSVENFCKIDTNLAEKQKALERENQKSKRLEKNQLPKVR